VINRLISPLGSVLLFAAAAAIFLVRPALATLWSPEPAIIRTVYKVRDVPTVVRAGRVAEAPPLGQLPPRGVVSAVDNDLSEDGWVHVGGRNWQGWAPRADLLGPTEARVRASSLAGLERLLPVEI